MTLNLDKFHDPYAGQFAAWMKTVDALLVRASGLCSSDLPDVSYRDWFDDRWSPVKAARRALDLAE